MVSALIGLLGVVLGFGMNEINQMIKKKKRIRHLKIILEKDMKSTLAQIEKKKELMGTILEMLEKRRVHTGRPVRSVMLRDQTIVDELYEYLAEKERNCLHVTMEYLSTADEFLCNFASNIERDIENNRYPDPFDMYASKFRTTQGTYERTEKLINSFLNKDPIDVFPFDALDG